MRLAKPQDLGQLQIGANAAERAKLQRRFHARRQSLRHRPVLNSPTMARRIHTKPIPASWNPNKAADPSLCMLSSILINISLLGYDSDLGRA